MWRKAWGMYKWLILISMLWTAAGAEPDPAAAYLAFSILQPSQQETLWGTEGSVDVVVEINPARARSSEPSAG